ncbi:piRNA biogenesis protein EXD1-like [Haliotis rufescens]|uniref:piRNA biogenesis protein EXD1-like n=1 Tax=Haliotis rufescens TaxID=6454 RepID=UPI00201F7E9C|nr:piRNA biogenesis protein EXD1-like [Haliotis rufescens]
MPRIHLVSSAQASEKAVHDILVSSPVVGVSCKGANAGGKGTIYLVAVATLQGDVYAFDVRRDKNIILDGGLVRLFQSTDVIKVIHDCAADAAALHRGFGVTLSNVFDTQVAQRVQMEEHGLPPRMINKSSLFAKYDIVGYTPSPSLERLLREDQHVWARRPLNKDMLNTAAADVVPLVTVLYDRLKSVLNPETADWFEYLCKKHRRSQLGGKKKTAIKGDNQPRRSVNEAFEMSVVKVREPKED